MRDRYLLEALGNDELLAALSTISGKDKALTADLLAHLAECDERRLHVDLGFPSMFAYCAEALGFCEATLSTFIGRVHEDSLKIVFALTARIFCLTAGRDRYNSPNGHAPGFVSSCAIVSEVS